MKKLLIILLFAPLAVSAQDSITWSEPIVVNANTTLDYSLPAIKDYQNDIYKMT